MLSLRRALPVLAASLFVIGQAVAGPIIEGTGTAFSDPNPLTLGWSFFTNQTIVVYALDAYDPVAGNQQVNLYNGSGNVLASANVTLSDPQTGSPTPFYSQAISPVTLAAGQTYYIAENNGNFTSGQFLTGVNPLTVDPSITYLSSVSAFGTGGLPTANNVTFIPGGSSGSYFGPDFEDTPPAPPPPSGLAVQASGGTPFSDPNNFTLGWSFSTNQATTITALDAYDPVAGNTQVYVYDSSGNIVASTDVTLSDPQNGLFYSQTISPVTLAAGQTYYIAENNSAGTSGEFLTGATLIDNPSITYLSGVSAFGTDGRPTADNVTFIDGGASGSYFGPDFEVAGSSTPEPSTIVLGACALLSFAACRRLKPRP